MVTSSLCVEGLEVVRSPMRAGGDIYRRLVVAIDKYRETPASDLQSQKRDICFGCVGGGGRRLTPFTVIS